MKMKLDIPIDWPLIFSCRAMHQIMYRYNVKRRVIAEDRVIWLKSWPLQSTLSHYTINYSRLCFPGIRRNLLEMFEHVQNVTTVWDSLLFLEWWPMESESVKV